MRDEIILAVRGWLASTHATGLFEFVLERAPQGAPSHMRPQGRASS